MTKPPTEPADRDHCRIVKRFTVYGLNLAELRDLAQLAKRRGRNVSQFVCELVRSEIKADR